MTAWADKNGVDRVAGLYGDVPIRITELGGIDHPLLLGVYVDGHMRNIDAQHDAGDFGAGVEPLAVGGELRVEQRFEFGCRAPFGWMCHDAYPMG